jgi:predicted transcriptional regulator
MPKSLKEDRERLTIRIEPSIKAKLDALAKERNMTTNKYVRAIAHNHAIKHAR